VEVFLRYPALCVDLFAGQGYRRTAARLGRKPASGGGGRGNAETYWFLERYFRYSTKLRGQKSGIPAPVGSDADFRGRS